MRERPDLSLAMAASLAIHGGILAGLLLTRPWEKELPLGAVVPVNIVSSSELTDLRAAAKADAAQVAQAEQVLPTPAPATPEPPEPEPKPEPAKSPPPAAAKVPAKPSLNLDALAASVARSAKAAKPAAAPRQGPAQLETALEARPAAGQAQGLSANALAGLAGELQRRWNPNCEVEGGRDVRVRVTFVVGPGGGLLGPVDAGGQERSPNSVVKAAADRAIRAVHQAAPFSNLPRDIIGQRVAVNFNAREACG